MSMDDLLYTRKRKHKSHNRKDYTGQKFGKLTCVEFVGLSGSPRSLKSVWKFKCDCGNIIDKVIYDIKNGKVKSCGCLNRACGKDSPHWKGCGEISATFFKSVKLGAAERSLELSVTIEHIWDLFLKQNRRCALTGMEIWFYAKDVEQTASLDRIDSNKGYVEGNLQWVHKSINVMKWDLDQALFLDYVKKIYEHRLLSVK